MFRKIPCIRIDGSRRKPSECNAAEEMVLALFVNGRHTMTATVSPGGLREFAAGYLFTEQIIAGAGEIESIREETNRISVLTTNPFRTAGAKKTVLSGCGGSTSYIDTAKLPIIPPGFSLSAAAVTGFMEEAIPRATGRIHTAALADAGGIVTRAEDIGRHNALDRVIGHGVLSGVDFETTCALCSGVISSEMVRKCLAARIPVIASRADATTLAADIARKTGLCVIGCVSGGGMAVYANPERLNGSTPSPE
ncbi:MAG: formate dehydrogenase family accessory protein FdhD [Methanoculleus sp. SDB]|nr:MAG: formate dehydrogenase family accessory protein FdhD [Methanoculleus sp. SDB]